MKNQHAAASVRVKEQEKQEELFKDDLHLKKEAGKLGILLFLLLGLVVGGLSLSAMVSAFLQLIK